MAPTSDVHVPIRTCVGCGRRAPQREFVRCALVDGAPVVDAPGTRRTAGRGAYLCGPHCLAPARKRRGFRRTWRVDVPPPVLDQLEELVYRVANGAPAARLID